MKTNKNGAVKQSAKTTDSNESSSISMTEKLQNILSNKYLHIFLLAAIALVFLVNYNAIFDKKLDLNGDNIVYYSLGKSLHDGTGYSNVMGFEVSPHTHFPPGYPAFISVLLNFVREGSFIPIKNANGCLLCLSIFLLFYILKRVTNNNVLLAFTAAILFCVQKDLLRWSTIMMSEMLFLFLTVLVIFAALILYQKKSFKEYKVLDYIAMGVMVLSIAYVYFVRTMGLAVILGLVGWLAGLLLYDLFLYFKGGKTDELGVALKQKFRYYGCLIGIVLLPFVVSKVSWDCRNRSIGHEKSDYIGDFHKKGGNGEVMTTFSDWTERIYNNSKAYLTKFMPETMLTRTYEFKAPIKSEDKVVGFVVFALVMIGFLGLGTGGFLIFCYLFVTFCVLLVWPEQFSSVRYYVAIVPFLLFLFLHGFYNIFNFSLKYIGKAVKSGLIQNNRTLLATIATMAVAFFWLIPTQSEAQARYRDLAKNSYKKIWNDPNCLNFFEAVEWCKTNIPDSARMVCRKPEIYYINSGFKHSVSFPHYASEDTVIGYLNKVKATHLILDNWFKHAYTTLYPAVKKYPEKFKVIKQIADVDTVNKINPVYIIQYNYDWGYHGELVNGKKEGPGSFLYQDGRKFVGNYTNDLPEGGGTLFDETGEVKFKGVWKEGKYYTGKGYWEYGDKKYSGEYREGLPNGYGVYSDSLGNVLAKGIWKNGILIQQQ